MGKKELTVAFTGNPNWAVRFLTYQTGGLFLRSV